MNVIIVGAGKVGSYLTSKLSDEGHNILVIEKNKDVLENQKNRKYIIKN